MYMITGWDEFQSERAFWSDIETLEEANYILVKLSTTKFAGRFCYSELKIYKEVEL